jgi:hypothetical protein
MSPSRTRRPVHRRRTRRELGQAIGGAVAVVLGTALIVWLLRPGTAGVEGTGGLASRQPRASWLVALTLAAGIAFCWYVWRHPRRWHGRFVAVLTGGCFAILLIAVVAGIVWPGGLLRHPEPVPTVDTGELPPTSLPPELSPTTVPGETTAPSSTETTVAATPTSAPAP